MATAALIPVSEYLKSTYHPDRDYVDGEVLERSMGEEIHAEIQAILTGILRERRVEWSVRVLTEARLRVDTERFRIPDICLVPALRPRGQVLEYPPVLCVEILSSCDTLTSMQRRVTEYISLGVQAVWVIDPEGRVAWHASARGYLQPEDGVLRVPGTAIAVALSELFAELPQ